MRLLLIQLFALIFLFSCNKTVEINTIIENETTEQKSDKIKILNVGTFHFGETPDAHSVDFDEHNKNLQKEIREISKMIAKFKPTIICVETSPKYNDKINAAYQKFLKSPSILNTNYGETSMVSFDVGRLCNVDKIYGIDHRMGYNYNIGNEIKNVIDSTWHNKYYKDPLKFYPEVNINMDSLNLLEKLKLENHPRYLDFLIAVNADMLTHVGSEKGFEGADEATKYYQRNLRMYSNLNRIKLNKNDRVFILMGASHTAFFKEFISRSPKYEMVNTLDYLK